ncbi:Gfo/Idh/MocA family protein [Nocardia nova]|uniref:Gfo/Idh/MocA family protein n=1 Tax=Nocardia nova TaxID=37330 RepID=UPI0033EC238E
MTLRVGMIGTGLAARSHALDIITDAEMVLAGVTARRYESAAAFSDMFGGTVYRSADDLVTDPSIDAVVVVVPPNIVLDIAGRVPSSMPCLIEKPVATTQADLHRITRLAGTHPLMVAPFNRRYQPHVRRVADVIAQGELGEVMRVEACWSGPYAARYSASASTFRSYAGPRQGVVVDNGSHALDLIESALPAWPTPEVADAAVWSSLLQNERGAEIQAHLRFRIRSVDIEVSLDDRPDHPDCGDWQVIFETRQGRATVDEFRSVLIDSKSGTITVPAEEMIRPTTDLVRLAHRQAPMGAALSTAASISTVLIAAYNRTDSSSRHWCRPRAKALGRLNGSC